MTLRRFCRGFLLIPSGLGSPSRRVPRFGCRAGRAALGGTDEPVPAWTGGPASLSAHEMQRLGQQHDSNSRVPRASRCAARSACFRYRNQPRGVEAQMVMPSYSDAPVQRGGRGESQGRMPPSLTPSANGCLDRVNQPWRAERRMYNSHGRYKSPSAPRRRICPSGVSSYVPCPPPPETPSLGALASRTRARPMCPKRARDHAHTHDGPAPTPVRSEGPSRRARAHAQDKK